MFRLCTKKTNQPTNQPNKNRQTIPQLNMDLPSAWGNAQAQRASWDLRDGRSSSLTFSVLYSLWENGLPGDWPEELPEAF